MEAVPDTGQPRCRIQIISGSSGFHGAGVGWRPTVRTREP
jgi:hypothetical protein